jgi:hypothetical protein
VFLKAIKSEDDVKIRLAETPRERAETFIGSFRSGELNGKVQRLDVEDIKKLTKSLVATVETTVIHEMEEAYQDQAINNSPTATQQNKEFDGTHNIALTSQLSGSEYVSAENIFAIDSRDGKGKVFTIGKKSSGSADVTIMSVGNDGQISSVENIANTRVNITSGATERDPAIVTVTGGTPLNN